jgi:quinol monooxygenase YgiN
MIHIIARWRAQTGKHEEVMKYVAEMTAETRKEAGNRRYDVYQMVSDPHFILLDEEYVSEDAVQAHRASAHFQKIVQGKIAPLLASRASEKTEKK